MRLDQSLNRRVLCRKLTTFATSRTDGRAFRPPNYLARACRFLELYVRQSRKMARADPHLFGPHASRYYADTVRMARQQSEIEAALEKVYGPPKPDAPSPGPDVWTRRYVLDPKWRHFRKWFATEYGRDV